LQLPSNTRWFSKWTLVNSIKENEIYLKSSIWHQSIIEKSKTDKIFKGQADNLRKILCQSPDFWKQVDLIEKLLNPLADAILKIEGSVVSVHDSCKLVDLAFQQSLTISEQFEEDQIDDLKQVIFIKYLFMINFLDS
jgi:hypothetical protein